MKNEYPERTNTLPIWALQRVEAALGKLGLEPHSHIDPMVLANKAGLSKSLTRRCIHQLRQLRQLTQ